MKTTTATTLFSGSHGRNLRQSLISGSSSNNYKNNRNPITISTASSRIIVAVLIIISSSLVHAVAGFQRFSEQPVYTEVNPGQDALLSCKVIDKRGTCSWQKDNKPVGMYPKKYEWAARKSSGNSDSLHLDLHPPPMQIGGDCSLWIRSATLDFDDGLWECQVTASDFTTQDALTSQPVRLVVRVAPQRPRLEFEGVHVPPGHNITVDSGSVATVKCVSHYGNPPATLKWFLGDQEIEPIHQQTNSTEPDNSRTWSATSVVQVAAMRERHGDVLRCVAHHESYTAKSTPVEARMDIKYAPTIRLIGSPEIDLEEDKDALVLRCVADANPPASIVWRRAGRSEIASLQETLQLRPVGRRDAGLYTCQAQNSVGTSEQLSVQLDVKYPPKIVSAGPDRLTTAPLFSPAAFECVADGNPIPSYKWIQRIPQGGSKFVERGHESRLVIDNVTYDYQGEYECRATSYINGQERVAVSEPISLQVVGAPQVLRLHPSLHTISVKRGEPATLSLVVCADPRPHRVAWEWGSLRLEAGSGIADRFRVDDVQQDSREDCYLSTLHIYHTDEHDSRPYYLVVENERGTDRHAIHLNVEEPLEMSYLLGIAGGCLAALLILICLCIYAVRSKKCCFKGSSGYKSSDKDSEKADLKSRSDSTSGPQGDSIYTTPAGFHHHQQQLQQQQQQQQQQHHSQLQQQQSTHHLHHAHHAHPGHGSPEAMKAINHNNPDPPNCSTITPTTTMTATTATATTPTTTATDMTATTTTTISSSSPHTNETEGDPMTDQNALNERIDEDTSKNELNNTTEQQGLSGNNNNNNTNYNNENEKLTATTTMTNTTTTTTTTNTLSKTTTLPLTTTTTTPLTKTTTPSIKTTPTSLSTTPRADDKSTESTHEDKPLLTKDTNQAKESSSAASVDDRLIVDPGSKGAFDQNTNTKTGKQAIALIQESRLEEVSGDASNEDTLIRELLHKLSNPFYRPVGSKQSSTSLKEKPTRRRMRKQRLRKCKSETDLAHVLDGVAIEVDTGQTRRPPSQRRRKRRSLSSHLRGEKPLSDNRGEDNGSSTVITNPFSIFHDEDELTLSVDHRLRFASSSSGQRVMTKQRSHRSERSLKRFFDLEQQKRQYMQHQQQMFLVNGVPVQRYERQDFKGGHESMTLQSSVKEAKKSRLAFKNLSLRKLTHRSSQGGAVGGGTSGGGDIAGLPQMKKMKISYPNRTQSIHSIRAYETSTNSFQSAIALAPGEAKPSSYLERLQAKTRIGLQKIKEKCRNLKPSGDPGAGFNVLSKDNSFRFIGDRSRINSYESRCAEDKRAARFFEEASGSGGKQTTTTTIYKSYKSEIDLSKNLHYLDAYLEENFDRGLREPKKSSHSVGRVTRSQMRQQREAMAERTRPEPNLKTSPGRSAKSRPRHHKRSNSSSQKGEKYAARNYENLGTLPMGQERRPPKVYSDSLSSSDYASVFSGPTAAAAAPAKANESQRNVTPTLPSEVSSEEPLRYEHPKASQYYFSNVPGGIESLDLDLDDSEDLLLAESSKAANLFFQDHDDVVPVVYARPSKVDGGIRILINEAEDGGDDLQEFHENLAESNFYHSLNEHLQRQSAHDESDESDVELRKDSAGCRQRIRSDLAKDLKYESYLEHFHRHKKKSNSMEYQAAIGDDDDDDEEEEHLQPLRGESLLHAQEGRNISYYEHGVHAYGANGAGPTDRDRLLHSGLSEKGARGLPVYGDFGKVGSPAALLGTATSRFGPYGDELKPYASVAKTRSPLGPLASRDLFGGNAMPVTGGSVTPVQAGPLKGESLGNPSLTPLTGGPFAREPLGVSTAASTTSAGLTKSATASSSNRYILDNIRKYYQHQHPPAHSVNSSSLSTSSSSTSSMSQHQHQQQQQQYKLHLPSAAAAGKYPYTPSSGSQAAAPPTAPHSTHIAAGIGNYYPRRNSNTSNASSSDNFDTFISLRQEFNPSTMGAAASSSSSSAAGAGAAAASPLALGKPLSKRPSQHTQISPIYQHQHPAYGHGGVKSVMLSPHAPLQPVAGGGGLSPSARTPLTTALNYYGMAQAADGLSSTTPYGSRPLSVTNPPPGSLAQQQQTPLKADQKAKTDNFILEYEC